MTKQQIIRLKNLIEKSEILEYSITEKLVGNNNLTGFHQWVDAKNYYGAYLISNENDESYWFVLIEWKPKQFYLVLYPADRKVPLVEIHIVEKHEADEKLVWTYMPRKRDGLNSKRLANFKTSYKDTSAIISFPKYHNEILDFYDEIFWLLNIKLKSESLDDIAPVGGYVFPEGRKIQRIHYSRERNRKVVELAKREFKRINKKLFCEICKFDFEKEYGKIGKDFIEAHHTLPLSLIAERQVQTKIEDLMMVCSNCHRMIHRKRPWLTKSQLKLLLV